MIQPESILCDSDSCVSCHTRCHRQQRQPAGRDDALALLFSHADFTLEAEHIPVRLALHRVTAQDIFANFSLPAAATSQHDGVAVCRAAAEKKLASGSNRLEKGEFLHCAMGTALPPPFDTVIPLERIRLEGECAVFSALPGQSGGTHAAGSSVRAGERIVPANHRLTPASLSFLRLAGVEEIPVWTKPRAVLFPIGGDLVAPGTVPGPGQYIESDSLLLSAILEECGGTCTVSEILPDSTQAICAALEERAGSCELMVLIGGAGTGGPEFGDCAVQAVQRMGRLLVQGTGFGPGGKPQFLGAIGGRPVVGIPGPPHAALTQAEQYLPAVMERFLGCPCYEREELTARLSDAFQSGARAGYHPHVLLRWEKGECVAYPVTMGDTADCFVNATAILMQDRDVAPGGTVPVRLVCGSRTARLPGGSPSGAPDSGHTVNYKK